MTISAHGLCQFQFLNVFLSNRGQVETFSQICNVYFGRFLDLYILETLWIRESESDVYDSFRLPSWMFKMAVVKIHYLCFYIYLSTSKILSRANNANFYDYSQQSHQNLVKMVLLYDKPVHYRRMH